MTSALYFDHNATTPLLPEVLEAMLPFLTTHFGNPSSAHALGRVAKEAVEQARAQVAALINAPPGSVIFTSGGTEASALALRGVLARARSKGLVTSTVEHPATAAVASDLERQGVSVRRVGVDEHGMLRTTALEHALTAPTALVSVIHAHNETGVVQRAADLARLARRAGARLHLDASQSAGKVALDVTRDGVDLLTLAAHKLYAPKGVGALVVLPGVELGPQQLGAGHESGRRAGTENVASLVGFGAACVAAKRDLASLAERLAALRALMEGLLRASFPRAVVAGADAERLPNTCYVCLPGHSATEVLARAPSLAASTGSACHDGHEAPPAVLLEMGFSPEVARGAVRLSLGRATTEAEVRRAVALLTAAAQQTRTVVG